MSVGISKNQSNAANSNEQHKSTNLVLPFGLAGLGIGGAGGYYFCPKTMTSKQILDNFSGENAQKFLETIKEPGRLSDAHALKLSCISNALCYRNKSALWFRAVADRALQTKDKMKIKPILNGYTFLRRAGINYGITGVAIAIIKYTKLAFVAVPSVLLKLALSTEKSLNKSLYNKMKCYIIKEQRLTKKLQKALKKPNNEMKIAKLRKKLLDCRSRISFYRNVSGEFAELIKNYKPENNGRKSILKFLRNGLGRVGQLFSGKVTMSKDNVEKVLKSEQEATDKIVLQEIEENSKGIKKYLPKIKSIRNAGIGGAIGLGVAVLVAKLFFGTHKKERND